ncbi:MAG: DedA family protein [Erysipelotrichales bacterium]
MPIIDFIIHIDEYLVQIVDSFGPFTYVILFLIIFCETGLVVTPFLPGDSLLFMTGALCAVGSLNIVIAWIILFSAAIIGDATNYTIGKYLGHKLIKKGWVKQANIDKTQAFFTRHGAKTIVLARFVPIVRTLAPFLAGSGDMTYRRFFHYNVIGGFLWVTIFVLGGYFFGNIPIVKDNLTLLVIGIIVISVLPMVIAKIISMRKKSS